MRNILHAKQNVLDVCRQVEKDRLEKETDCPNSCREVRRAKARRRSCPTVFL